MRTGVAAVSIYARIDMQSWEPRDRIDGQPGPMRKVQTRIPSPALVVSLVALLLALSGASYAAFSLPKNSVGTKQLKDGAVTTQKIKNGAVTKAKLNVTGLTVPNALHANSANNATHADNATHATTAGSATHADTAGSATPSGAAGGALTGNYPAPSIANGAVHSPDLGPIHVRTGSVVISNGSSNFATATCAAGERVIGVGTNWNAYGTGRYTSYVHIFGNGAQGRGVNSSGANLTFIVEAYCLG